MVKDDVFQQTLSLIPHNSYGCQVVLLDVWWLGRAYLEGATFLDSTSAYCLVPAPPSKLVK